MPTKPTIHPAVRATASAELSAVMKAMAADPSRTRPPTLGDVRAALQGSGTQWSPEGELLHLQDRTSLVIELDDLIGRYSADKLAEAVTRSV
jgi:hypothetical protein